jgi:hypothetical protein
MIIATGRIVAGATERNGTPLMLKVSKVPHAVPGHGYHGVGVPAAA